MKNFKLKIMVLFSLFACFGISCGKQNAKTETPVAETAPGLTNVTTELPKAPGSQAFNANCVICHSARMVQNQPNFPEKTWTAIVTKMQKTYGAPVSDSAAKIIIQYLVSIKGKG